MDSGPKFTGVVWLNAGGIARYHMSFRFLIPCLVLEIYAIKVGSCEKTVKILHVFGPQRSMTLNDLELLLRQIVSDFRMILRIWEATMTKRMKIDP